MQVLYKYVLNDAVSEWEGGQILEQEDGRDGEA